MGGGFFVAKFYHSGDKTGPAAARYENHF